MAAIHRTSMTRPARVSPVYGRGLSAVVFTPITALFGMAFETRLGLSLAAVVAWAGAVAMLSDRVRGPK